MPQLETLQLRLRSLHLPTAARVSGEVVTRAQQANWSLEARRPSSLSSSPTLHQVDSDSDGLVDL